MRNIHMHLSKEYMIIPLDIYKHCRKTYIYSVWIKKGEGGNFDVSSLSIYYIHLYIHIRLYIYV